MREMRKVIQIPFWFVELAGIAVILLLAGMVHAQTLVRVLPDSPSVQAAPSMSWVPQRLLSAPLSAEILGLTDTAIRVGDVITTYRLLNNPCHCFKEADPIAPKGSALLPSIAFQASAGAAIYLGSQFLRAHHHLRLAYALQVVDIESETYAVFANNIPLLARVPAVTYVPSVQTFVGAK